MGEASARGRSGAGGVGTVRQVHLPPSTPSLPILKANFLFIVHRWKEFACASRSALSHILTITWLTAAAGPASASEAFIAQLTTKAAATEPSSANSAKTLLSAALLALPLQPKAANSPAANATNAATNTALVTQIGANNVAAVSQTGGGNAAAVMQHGNGNQAVVTQRH